MENVEAENVLLLYTLCYIKKKKKICKFNAENLYYFFHYFPSVHCQCVLIEASAVSCYGLFPQKFSETFCFTERGILVNISSIYKKK